MRPVEPHRVVETGNLQIRIKDGASMRKSRRIKQSHVGQIGKNSALYGAIRGNGARRAYPDILFGGQFLAARIVFERDRPDFERPLSRPKPPDDFRHVFRMIDEMLLSFKFLRSKLVCWRGA